MPFAQQDDAARAGARWARVAVMPARFAAVVVLLGWLTSACVCTDLNCTSRFIWFAALPVGLSHTDIRRLTVSACRNDECRVALLDVAEPEPGTGYRIPLLDPAAPFAPSPVTATIFRSLDGTYRLTTTWIGVALPAGDRHRVEVTDPAGAVVMGLAEELVEYDVLRPNGPHCEPECRFAQREGSTLGVGP